MKRQDLLKALDENESIFRGIVNHARGGPSPARVIPGLTPDMVKALDVEEARRTSVEFATATKEVRASLGAEIKKVRSEKTGNARLQQLAEASSQMVAAYVSRLQWMVDQGVTG